MTVFGVRKTFIARLKRKNSVPFKRLCNVSSGRRTFLNILREFERRSAGGTAGPRSSPNACLPLRGY